MTFPNTRPDSVLVAEAKRAADGEGLGDSQGRCRIADHHVHLVRPSAENELRSRPSSGETFKARPPHRRQRLEWPSTGSDLTASARCGFPSDDNDDGATLRDTVCADLAVRRLRPGAGRPNDEKGPRICDGSIIRRGNPMPSSRHDQCDAMCSEDLAATSARDRDKRKRHHADEESFHPSYDTTRRQTRRALG